LLEEADDKEREAAQIRDRARHQLEASYGLDNDRARAILAAFKPPR
jgi:hypothetical protein